MTSEEWTLQTFFVEAGGQIPFEDSLVWGIVQSSTRSQCLCIPKAEIRNLKLLKLRKFSGLWKAGGGKGAMPVRRVRTSALGQHLTVRSCTAWCCWRYFHAFCAFFEGTEIDVVWGEDLQLTSILHKNHRRPIPTKWKALVFALLRAPLNEPSSIQNMLSPDSPCCRITSPAL